MLYTIGYEGLDISSFVEELREQKIRVLIDVRELPLSRKKGFSKSALNTVVTAAGVKYIHLRDLARREKSATNCELPETGRNTASAIKPIWTNRRMRWRPLLNWLPTARSA